MNSYRYSSDANGDIEKIALYLFDLNPVAACRFLDGLEKACELLAEHPLMGRPRPELAENLRSFPIGNYLSSTRPRRMALTLPVLFTAGVICRHYSNTAQKLSCFPRFSPRFYAH